MSSKIHILPETLANQIAAGEVVERAASVLKELVENSLDAGAHIIKVILKNHGRDLIQVVDNGEGISVEDLPMAFERHATSKIKTLDDLFALQSLGFRGEALPSIAAVARVEIHSHRRGDDHGWCFRVDGGTSGEVEPSSVPEGTSLSVKSLFFNTPARRKFLKSPTTEYAHLLAVFKRFALAYPEVDWTLIHDNRPVYELRPGDLKTRIVDLYGAKTGDQLREIDNHEGDTYISGFVGTTELVRRSRGDQFIFLNNRPIENRIISHAVIAGMDPMVRAGEYPFYVLKIQMDPHGFDVNVHPSKSEVKFRDESTIHQLVRHAVRAAFSATDLPTVTNTTQTQPLAPAQKPIISTPGIQHPIKQKPIPPDVMDSLYKPPDKDVPRISTPTKEHPKEQKVRPKIPTTPESEETVAIWQLHNKYILSQIKSGLAIIDQHAAHERILFERALRYFQNPPNPSQHLLFPEILELTIEDWTTLKDYAQLFKDLGFILSDFGPRTIRVEAVPSGIRISNEGKLLKDLLDEVREQRKAHPDPREALATSFACRGAVKSGDSLTTAEMNALVNELFRTEFPYSCPHGRPTIINLSLDELDRRFRRT
jgi:DNA mismatch repair protein MutL